MQIDINYDNGLSDIANNIENNFADIIGQGAHCLLYTSDAADE